MKNLLLIFFVTGVAVGCGNSESNSQESFEPIVESFEMYTRGVYPEGKKQRFHRVVRTELKDSSISFKHIVDSNSVLPVTFIFHKDSTEIRSQKLEGYCYTTSGPYLIDLRDTFISIYKIEIDCENMIDEEGVQLYSPEIGFVGVNSYAWFNGTLIDSLYGHTLSNYAGEMRDSVLNGSFDLLQRTIIAKPETSF